MWDAFNGSLRCTYRGYNAVDEVESALSVSFSADGQQVIGGYKNSIKIFATNVPGRDYQQLAIRSPASALTVHNQTIAIGSWNGGISFYDQRQFNKEPYMYIVGDNAGVTQLKFFESGNYLASGSRKNSNLLIWDMRNISVPWRVFERAVSTNQRIYFDISENEQWLVSGDTAGMAHVWNIKNFDDIQQTRVCYLFFFCIFSSFPPTNSMHTSYSSLNCIWTVAMAFRSIRPNRYWRRVVDNTTSHASPNWARMKRNLKRLCR